MSDKKARVETYFEGFRRSDHTAILALLSDDVRWDMPGFKHLSGKAAFDAEIENPDFSGSPILTIDRLYRGRRRSRSNRRSRGESEGRPASSAGLLRRIHLHT